MYLSIMTISHDNVLLTNSIVEVWKTPARCQSSKEREPPTAFEKTKKKPSLPSNKNCPSHSSEKAAY